MKRALTKLMNGKTFPVFFGPLRGIRLKFTPLIKGSNYFRAYEADKQKAFDHFLKPGFIFFDIGANVGLHSYYIAKHHPEVRVFSFEPLPENVTYISETIATNKLTSISVLALAVSVKTGESFFDRSDNNSKGMLSGSQTGLKVKTISLDDYVTEMNLYPDVVKIDVEGAESLVLEGAENIMNHKPPIFIIELHNPEQDLKVAKILTSFGYKLYRLNAQSNSDSENLLLKIQNIRASWPDPAGVWGNIVAVKENLQKSN